MKSNRRQFLKSAGIAGGASALLPLSAASGWNEDKVQERYAALDKIMKKPVLKREMFPEPIIIESLELLRDRNNTLCRVRSRDGVEGLAIGHPFIAKNSFPMFTHILRRRFLGKDARDLDELMLMKANRPVKNEGIPLCVQMAVVEFAILDMLGVIAGKPAGQVIGDPLRDEVQFYLGHHYSNLRRLPPEESLALMGRDAEETRARAIKLRAGSGDQMGRDLDNAPGRTEKLIRMAREIYGEDMVLMIDGNGSYSVKEAIRIGKILEEYNYYFYEEPIPWDWYEEQKLVEMALDIPMAGGEEEFGLHAFRYLAGNEVFQILQPDLFYFGGMIRTMIVARMCEAMGLQITPHISAGGLGYVYMMQMVGVCPAAAEYHEFKMFHTRDANGTMVPVESKTQPFASHDGLIYVPTGTGLGVRVDPEYVKTHKPVEV